jgi:putative NADH-flavin reductase
LTEKDEQMRIAVIGASGSVGSRVVAEALARGHRVTGVARRAELISPRENLAIVAGDIGDPVRLAEVLAGHDVVVSAVRFVGLQTGKLLEALKRARSPRLVMVGGAGSLSTTGGGLLLEAPTFPQAAKAEATTGTATLQDLREQEEIEWTFISPSAVFVAGERTGKYRLGKDQLLVDAEGKSRISQEDYAIALIDEVETPRHRGERFTVGY